MTGRQGARRLGYVLIAIVAAGALRAQTPATPLERNAVQLRLHRLVGPPDGGAWNAVVPLSLVMREPVFGAPMTEHTEIRVAYDAQNLYVQARLDDSDPSGMRANSLYRDRTSGDDMLGVIVDAFNDRENALWFWTTPAGIRGDAAITGDGRSISEAWNGFWDATVTSTKSGWSAQIAIPFTTLGFRSDGVGIVMGLTVYRYIARKNERHIFPAITPDYDLLRPSQAQRVQLEGVSSRRRVYVTPYALVGIEREAATEQDGLRRRFASDAGVDLRYNVTPQLTLDVTANTDFAQAEADDQQVNLTRFSLFFPERRRFFQERAGVFGFATGGDGLLFHSRRIGLRDGQPVPIVGGLRLVGRLAAWEVGLLEMQTASSDSAASENFGVLRIRRQILNQESYAGSLITTRIGADGAANLAGGVDAVMRLFGDDYLTVRAARSLDQPAGRVGEGRSSAGGIGRILWERRRSAGTRYIATAGTVAPRYMPGLGFVPRTGVTDLAAAFSHPRYGNFQGGFTRVDPLQLSGSVVMRRADRRVESASVEYNSDFEWRSGAELSGDVEAVYEDLADALDLPRRTVIPAGRYTFFRLDVGMETPPGDLLRAEFDMSLGTFYDGWRTSVAGEGRWNASRHLEIAAEYTLDVVRFPVRAQGFNSHIARVRLGGALNTRASATAFVQYGSVNRDFGSNLRLRYNFAEGHDVWLVIDEVRGGIPGPDQRQRTLLAKYTRTYIW